MEKNIVIPIGFDSEDRIKNFEISFEYLKQTFPNWGKTLIAQNFTGDPYIQTFLQDKADKYTKVIIIDKALPFHKTLLYNTAIAQIQEDIIITYDLDCLIEKHQVEEAVLKIEQGYDYVFPFTNPTYHVENKSTIELEHLRKISRLSTSPHNWKETKQPDIAYAPGWISVINKRAWIESGMENEEMLGAFAEDAERICKFVRLGYKCTRVYGDIFHLEHERAVQNQFALDVDRKNQLIFEKIQALKLDEYQEYYKIQKSNNLKKYNIK